MGCCCGDEHGDICQLVTPLSLPISIENRGLLAAPEACVPSAGMCEFRGAAVGGGLHCGASCSVYISMCVGL